MEEAAFGVVQGLFMLLSFALWLLPVAIAVWVLIRMSAMSRDLGVMKRQLSAIADHSGAPIVPQPPQPPRARAPLWAFAVVLVVFLLVMALLYAMPGMSGMSSGPMDVEFEAGDSVRGSGTISVPAEEELPAMPDPVAETPGG